jgi:copper transport protein
VSLRSDDVDLGRVPVRPVAAGTYAADVTLPTTGPWEAQVSLPVSEFDNPVTTLALVVD